MEHHHRESLNRQTHKKLIVETAENIAGEEWLKRQFQPTESYVDSRRIQPGGPGLLQATNVGHVHTQPPENAEGLHCADLAKRRQMR